jgi:hypothetical protein
MSAPTRRISIKQLVSLITIASTSVFLGFPASALNNSNPGSLKESFNNRSANSTARSRQLLVQGTSGTGGMGGTGTGTGTGQNGTGAGGMGTGGTGTGTGQNGTVRARVQVQAKTAWVRARVQVQAKTAWVLVAWARVVRAPARVQVQVKMARVLVAWARVLVELPPGTGRSNGQQDAFTQYC